MGAPSMHQTPPSQSPRPSPAGSFITARGMDSLPATPLTARSRSPPPRNQDAPTRPSGIAPAAKTGLQGLLLGGGNGRGMYGVPQFSRTAAYAGSMGPARRVPSTSPPAAEAAAAHRQPQQPFTAPPPPLRTQPPPPQQQPAAPQLAVPRSSSPAVPPAAQSPPEAAQQCDDIEDLLTAWDGGPDLVEEPTPLHDLCVLVGRLQRDSDLLERHGWPRGNVMSAEAFINALNPRLVPRATVRYNLDDFTTDMLMWHLGNLTNRVWTVNPAGYVTANDLIMELRARIVGKIGVGPLWQRYVVELRQYVRDSLSGRAATPPRSLPSPADPDAPAAAPWGPPPTAAAATGQPPLVPGPAGYGNAAPPAVPVHGAASAVSLLSATATSAAPPPPPVPNPAAPVPAAAAVGPADLPPPIGAACLNHREEVSRCRLQLTKLDPQFDGKASEFPRYESAARSWVETAQVNAVPGLPWPDLRQVASLMASHTLVNQSDPALWFKHNVEALQLAHYRAYRGLSGVKEEYRGQSIGTLVDFIEYVLVAMKRHYSGNSGDAVSWLEHFTWPPDPNKPGYGLPPAQVYTEYVNGCLNLPEGEYPEVNLARRLMLAGRNLRGYDFIRTRYEAMDTEQQKGLTRERVRQWLAEMETARSTEGGLQFITAPTVAAAPSARRAVTVSYAAAAPSPPSAKAAPDCFTPQMAGDLDAALQTTGVVTGDWFTNHLHCPCPVHAWFTDTPHLLAACRVAKDYWKNRDAGGLLRRADEGILRAEAERVLPPQLREDVAPARRRRPAYAPPPAGTLVPQPPPPQRQQQHAPRASRRTAEPPLQHPWANRQAGALQRQHTVPAHHAAAGAYAQESSLLHDLVVGQQLLGQQLHVLTAAMRHPEPQPREQYVRHPHPPAPSAYQASPAAAAAAPALAPAPAHATLLPTVASTSASSSYWAPSTPPSVMHEPAVPHGVMHVGNFGAQPPSSTSAAAVAPPAVGYTPGMPAYSVGLSSSVAASSAASTPPVMAQVATSGPLGFEQRSPAEILPHLRSRPAKFAGDPHAVVSAAAAPPTLPTLLQQLQAGLSQAQDAAGGLRQLCGTGSSPPAAVITAAAAAANASILRSGSLPYLLQASHATGLLVSSAARPSGQLPGRVLVDSGSAVHIVARRVACSLDLEVIPFPSLSITTAAGRSSVMGVAEVTLTFASGTPDVITHSSSALVVEDTGAEAFDLILGTEVLWHKFGCDILLGGPTPLLRLRRGYHHPQPCAHLPTTSLPIARPEPMLVANATALAVGGASLPQPQPPQQPPAAAPATAGAPSAAGGQP
ncbi:hypothetical protein Agub_g15559 [Astrephomene gubernaculifera]|uniref:Uncharacterized protein n=1 Tax=Astrephomene gubernaculifera TaxID=47775 RepID=A0AAD3E5F3_9CHLO|nr:hypothetical protein Agub_g15559 [Astrephomene gubernaculifera]